MQAYPPVVCSSCSSRLAFLWQLGLFLGASAPLPTPTHSMHPYLFPLQIGEFVFVLLSVASQQELIDEHVYLLLMGAALCWRCPAGFDGGGLGWPAACV